MLPVVLVIFYLSITALSAPVSMPMPFLHAGVHERNVGLGPIVGDVGLLSNHGDQPANLPSILGTRKVSLGPVLGDVNVLDQGDDASEASDALGPLGHPGGAGMGGLIGSVAQGPGLLGVRQTGLAPVLGEVGPLGSDLHNIGVGKRKVELGPVVGDIHLLDSYNILHGRKVGLSRRYVTSQS